MYKRTGYIVNLFTDVAQLISFATFWNIHDLPVVWLRLFQRINLVIIRHQDVLLLSLPFLFSIDIWNGCIKIF